MNIRVLALADLGLKRRCDSATLEEVHKFGSDLARHGLFGFRLAGESPANVVLVPEPSDTVTRPVQLRLEFAQGLQEILHELLLIAHEQMTPVFDHVPNGRRLKRLPALLDKPSSRLPRGLSYPPVAGEFPV